MEKRLKEMATIMNEKGKEINGKALPPLDPEGKAVAKNKRETFDVIGIPVDPLR